MPDVWVILASGSPGERAMRVDGRLFIGRECAGVDEAHRLLLEEAAVSRDHAEIRVSGDGAVVIDRSTNGTRINGRLIERDELHLIGNGDLLTIGSVELTLRVLDDSALAAAALSVTDKATPSGRMAVLVGDIVDYTTLTETRGGVVMADAAERLWQQVRPLVITHGGTISNYAGDAVLATWDAGQDGGVAAAVRCAIAAEAAVRAWAPQLEVRARDGGPIRMGWAVTVGEVAIGRTSPSKLAVVGDAVNLAFRLSGVAGREDMPSVLVTDEVAQAASPDIDLGTPSEVVVKGKTGTTTVRGASHSDAG